MTKLHTFIDTPSRSLKTYFLVVIVVMGGGTGGKVAIRGYGENECEKAVVVKVMVGVWWLPK